MAQDRKALLAVILAVKRGFVSAEEGMDLLDQAEREDTEDAAATVFDRIPRSQVDGLRHDATVLADDTAQAEKLMQEAGLAPEIQQTLLHTDKEPPKREDIEATLLSLAPTRMTTIIERPKLKTATDERYKILREHARGGMGRILVAEDKVVGREVALKELLPSRGPSGSVPASAQRTPGSATTSAAAARFLREATVTGQLEHPNIVPVYEIGQRDDGSIYYTMKFVKGRTLANKLRAIRTDVDMSVAQKQAERMKLLDGFVDICNAIAFAHSRGVIHRDLKPANIMLGDFGEAMVLDWGLARVVGGENTALAAESNHDVSPDLTLEGEVMGTPAYMPPEQAAGKIDQVDERSDVYSLGAVLFEIVSGEAPYVGKTAKQVLSSVLSEDPRRITEVAEDVPPELAALVMRCLERRPEDRFQSARTLAEEVQAFRDGRMVSTYRYSAIELLKRFVSKNQGAVAVSALALLLMIAGGVYAYTSVKSERDSALKSEAEATVQKGIAQRQAEEAERQAAEAERQKGIAKDQAAEAERQKSTAVLKAEEAEFERKRADGKAIEAANKAEEARISEERASKALEQARRNLAQAHMGYATLAEERGQPGGQVLHLAAAHAADSSAVSSDQLVAALSETAFPIWRSRSYIDLPAGVSVFSADRRLCAAGMYEPPKLINEIPANSTVTAFPDVGIWDVATGTLLRRISTETQTERHMALNGDGTRLAALEENGVLRIWDISTGEEISSRTVYPWSVAPLIVSAPDGSTFFTAGDDGKVWEWNFADGSSVRVREMKDTTYSALAVSADGKRVATGSYGNVLVWNLETDEPPLELPMLDESISGLCFSPDGLLVGLAGTAIELWDVGAATKMRSYQCTSWSLSSLEISPDGKHIVVGLFDQGWKLFDYISAEIIQQRDHSGGKVQGISFSPDSSALVVALKGEGFDVLGFDGTPLLERAFDHLLGSMAVDISPDGQTFASGDHGGRLLLRRVSDGTTVWSCNASTNSLMRVQFSPDGSMLAVYSDDDIISLFDTKNGALLRSVNQPSFVYSLKFSPDGRYLIAPTLAGPVHLINTETATIQKTLNLGVEGRVICVAFDPNRNRVWMTDNSMRAWRWDYDVSATAAKLGNLSIGGTRYIYTTTISPDGNTIQISMDDGSILGWQTEPFAQLYCAKVGEGPIINCAFGSGSAFFACGTATGMLCFVDARTGRVVKQQRAHRSAITGTAVSPNGRDIITSGVDGEFLAWDAPPMMYPDVNQLGASSASQLSISPDGKLAGVAVDSGLIKILDVESGRVVGEIDVLPEYVVGLAFSPDSSLLAACQAGGKVLVWDVESNTLVREILAYDYPTSVAFARDGRLLVNGQYYGLQVIDTASGERLQVFENTSDYFGINAFPGGKRALQTSYSEAPRIIDLQTGQILASLERSSSYSGAAAISPDGTVVAMVRDRGLIGIHDSENGERLRSIKVRPDYLKHLQFLPDGRRLFYLTQDGGAAVVDVNTGQELAGTWFGYSYLSGGGLAPDASFALILSGTGELERWNLEPILARSKALASLDIQTVMAMVQLQSGMILNNLETISLPRRTGRVSWTTSDGKPPSFLDDELPDWVPRLLGAEVNHAREFMRGERELRKRRQEAYAREWLGTFEGYRYRDVVESDLSTTRVLIPAREKDVMGNYIGEPEGRVDMVRWLDSKRQAKTQPASADTERLAQLGTEAEQRLEWELAMRYLELATALDPSRLDLLIQYSNACLQAGEVWNATWRLSERIKSGTRAQQAEMHLIWGRLLGWEWDRDEALKHFDAARENGYSGDDWYLYRVEALKQLGVYREAAAAAEQYTALVKDNQLRTALMAARIQCLYLAELQSANSDLPRILVLDVAPESAAGVAGLAQGDILVGMKAGSESRFDIEAFFDVSGFRYNWSQLTETGTAEIQSATLFVRRNGELLKITMPRGPFDAKLIDLKAAG